LAAAEFIEAKRRTILAAESRIDYFIRQMTERPRLAGLWRYWMHWYRVRRADWLTRSYVEQCRAWKRLLRTWEREGSLEQHLTECNVIAKNVDVIEDGLKIIETELRETLDLARERKWHIRYPRPQTTMEGWISSIHDRYPIIREWIKRIREELPKAWVSIVYVIYYAYTSPDAERHLEAHLETLMINDKKILPKVKELANKILRAFVAAPRVVAGEIRPGYETPLLRADMAKPPYEGRIISGQNMWQWGLQISAEINYMAADKRVVLSETPIEIKAFKTVPMRLELFDFDYVQLRSYLEREVPALWWTLALEQLLEILGIEVER
jgi:hypothetical protein